MSEDVTTKSDGHCTEYRLAGVLHREDGPAWFNSYNEKEYWMNGLRHRLDGPAVEYVMGFRQWWINGFLVDGIIQPWAKEMNIDLENLTEEDKVLIAMVWSNYKE